MKGGTKFQESINWKRFLCQGFSQELLQKLLKSDNEANWDNLFILS